MDEERIHSAAAVIIVFAFIFIIPVRTIPYSAIESISEENGVLTLLINKYKIDMIPILRIISGKILSFTAANPKTIFQKVGDRQGDKIYG